MTTSTFATVAVPAADQAAAQADMPGFFVAPFTTDPAGAPPATHFVSTGHFFDSELDFIVNDAAWPRQVRFGPADAALAAMGLVAVRDEEPAE